MAFWKTAKADFIVSASNWRDQIAGTSISMTKEKLDEIIASSPYLNKEDFAFYIARFVSGGEKHGYNENRDFFPAEELAKNFNTFLFRGVYENHDNDDPEKARGLIPYVEYDASNEYVWGVLAIDKNKYSRLVQAIDDGNTEGTSMGCMVLNVKCPICGSLAETSFDYCSHLANKEVYDAYDICQGVNFVEQSVLTTEDPADPKALITQRIAKSNKKKESFLDVVNFKKHSYSLYLGNDLYQIPDGVAFKLASDLYTLSNRKFLNVYCGSIFKISFKTLCNRYLLSFSKKGKLDDAEMEIIESYEFITNDGGRVNYDFYSYTGNEISSGESIETPQSSELYAMLEVKLGREFTIDDLFKSKLGV